MAYWSSKTLKARLPGLIEPYAVDRVLHCAYELGVGAEAFITSGEGTDTHLPERGQVVLPPGQFGFLITKEIVTVPETAIAFISMRAGVKFRGLVNVSGFHVDPGFRGHLKFAVYNAGSQTIRLDQDQRIFMIWYADLDGATDDPYGDGPIAPPIITADDVMKIQGEVASPAQLKSDIDELKKEVARLGSVLWWAFATLAAAAISLIGGLLIAVFVNAVLLPHLRGDSNAQTSESRGRQDESSQPPTGHEGQGTASAGSARTGQQTTTSIPLAPVEAVRPK